MKMGNKQQRRAHFHMQPRGPEGLADAGVPFLDSSLGMQRRIERSINKPLLNGWHTIYLTITNKWSVSQHLNKKDLPCTRQ
jgi:hypothetical protein